MNYVLYLAIKYLKPQKDKFFSYLSLFISITGIAIGVATLIVTLGIMTGFHKEIKSRLESIYPHIMVTSQTFIPEEVFKQENNIKFYSPFIYSQAMLKYNDKVYTVVVKGVNYETETKVVQINKVVHLFESNSISKEDKYIILGKELAKNLGVNNNDEVVMILPTTIVTPFGNLPLTEKFKVKGILSSGIYEYDNNLCMIDYTIALKLFTQQNTNVLNGVHGYGIKLVNESLLENTKSKLKQQFGVFTKVVSWIELNYNLFTALKLEKVMMIIIVSLIIIVASFIIMSNLLLKGMQKSKDIGILLAIGVNKNDVKKVFFFQGMIINLAGLCLGTTLGFLLGFLIKKYQFIKLPKEVYYIDKIPVYFSLPDISLVLAITIIVGIIASFYPAAKISQFDPVEILRYG